MTPQRRAPRRPTHTYTHTSTSGASTAVLMRHLRRTSKLALLALALALAPLLVLLGGWPGDNLTPLLWASAATGMGMGLIAWARTKSQEHLRGRGYAVAAAFFWPALLCLVIAGGRFGLLRLGGC